MASHDEQLNELRTRLAAVERALEASDARFTAIVEKSLGAVTLSRADGTRVYASPAAAALLGYTPAEFLGLTRRQLIHPDDQPRIDRELAALLERPGQSVESEWRAIHRDGTHVWIEATITNLLADPVGALVVCFRDVTDRKRAEEALRESRALVEQAQALAQLGSWTGSVDPNEPLSYSDECYRILGLPLGEPITGAHFFTRVHPDDVAAVGAAMQRTTERGDDYDVEFRIVRPDGELRWVHAHARPRPAVPGKPLTMIGFVRDVTAERRSEEQLRQAARMDAVGSLAGGVAHDFNNLLHVVVGYTSLILDALPPGAPLRSEVEQVRAASDRAVALTRQLLAFSRRQVLRPVVLDLNRVVRDFDQLFRPLIGENITMVVHSEAEPALVSADPSQLEQVIMNLALNARDAMPRGGTLTIETRSHGLDVELRVTDTGEGIDESVRQRIFEPFFTTKEKGKGTGLGLSTVFGIVSQSGGHIAVDSKKGQGTTFSVHLPRSERPLEQPGALPEATPRSGSETILLVEDDQTVRELTRTVLSRSGYRVLEAQNAGEALLISEQHAGKIELLLTDVVMPRIDGRVLAERLLRVRPELKVVFMSGYADDLAKLQGVLEAGAAFIPKPVEPAVLERMLREVLDG